MSCKPNSLLKARTNGWRHLFWSEPSLPVSHRFSEEKRTVWLAFWILWTLETVCECLLSSTVILHLHSPYILTLALEKLFHPSFSLIFSNLSCCTFSLSLSRVYEEHILATGSLDERIFTGEGASEEIGTPGPCLSEGLENQNSAISRLHVSLTVRQQARVFMFTVSHRFLIFLITPSLYGHQASALKVATPLTGRKYIQENVVASPISTAMNSVGRLHTLLSGTQQGPSAKLAETFGCVPQIYFLLEAGRV